MREKSKTKCHCNDNAKKMEDGGLRQRMPMPMRIRMWIRCDEDLFPFTLRHVPFPPWPVFQWMYFS